MTPAHALAALGCRLYTADVDEPATARACDSVPDIALVVTGDDLGRAGHAIRWIRGSDVMCATPILVVLPADRLPALDHAMGHDDFLVTPFAPFELYARVRQLDRRSASFHDGERIELGVLAIDVVSREVRVNNRMVNLTRMEFDLLTFLMRHPGRVFTRDALLEAVWKDDSTVGLRTVDVHVRRIRTKLGSALPLIETVRNVGYKAVALRGTRELTGDDAVP